ncbi:hypothetical protein [Lewinella sp. LCG006]|uniref:hypothetical protein n=1 Tax=Lewinella sp. LCG006 TaxID=3231911 RepID=UPI003460C334
MKQFLLFTLTFALINFAQAQISWDGGGDGTSWNDAANWVGDLVPPADSSVVFPLDATITGTMTNIPGQVRIAPNTNVTLDLDLTIGNGIIDEHAIVLNDTCSLTIGSPGNNRTVTINTTTTKHGVVIFGGTDGAQLTIAESTTFAVAQALTAINHANATSTVTNNGTITLDNSLKDGLRVSGAFTNNGTIVGGALQTDVINIKAGATFTNTATGVITADKPGDDGIDISEDAVFINEGTLVLTSKDDAGSANSGISVGNADTGGSFINNSANVVSNGGVSPDARAVYIYAAGTLTNNGLLTLTGGNEGNRFFVQGIAVNSKDAILDLTDGRANVSGEFTNNGLVRSTRDGSGIFATGTVTNNAFFDYSNSNAFGGGAMATIIDNGISLNNNDSRINAMNNCTVDIAEEAYEWFVDGVSLATADATGAFSFPENSVMADSVVMTTTIPGIEVKVINICNDAVVMDTGLFGPANTPTALQLFPNLLHRGDMVNVDLRALAPAPITFMLVNANGQIVETTVLPGGTLQSLNTGNWPAGLYLLRSVSEENNLVGRLIIQ